VRDEPELRSAVADLGAVLPSSPGVLLQPMAGPGTELIVGAVRDPQSGPMVMLGAGGTLADVLDDRTFRLAPLTNEHAEAMIAQLRVARLLDGYRGRPITSRAAERDVLVGVAALVIARIRIAPARPELDPLVRQLRGPVSPIERTK
jgi:acetate---CoA ligase (ADP-forming)